MLFYKCWRAVANVVNHGQLSRRRSSRECSQALFLHRIGSATFKSTEHAWRLKWCVCMPQFADSIGLPTSEGLFGFKPFPEVGTAVEALFYRCSRRLPSFHASYFARMDERTHECQTPY